MRPRSNPLLSYAHMQSSHRIKAPLTDKVTWVLLVYMLLQFVLGTVYFVLIVTVLSFSLSFIVSPFFMAFWDLHGQFIVNNNDLRDILPKWSYPLLVLFGILLWTGFMNLAKGIG